MGSTVIALLARISRKGWSRRSISEVMRLLLDQSFIIKWFMVLEEQSSYRYRYDDCSSNTINHLIIND